MPRGQLPKAYLRIDPNLGFTHPHPGPFLKLLALANAQPRRGRFKEWTLIAATIGTAFAVRLRDRGDVVRLEDGTWYVAGWDEWQEEDLTVGERMRRMRERRNGGRNTTPAVTPSDRNGGVTRPFQNRNSPSEASRRLGVKERSNTSPPSPPLPRGAPAAANGNHQAAVSRIVAFASGKLGLRFDRKARRGLLERLKGGETEEQLLQHYRGVAKELEDLEGPGSEPLQEGGEP